MLVSESGDLVRGGRCHKASHQVPLLLMNRVWGRPAHQVAVRKCSCVVSYERQALLSSNREKILNETCRCANM